MKRMATRCGAVLCCCATAGEGAVGGGHSCAVTCCGFCISVSPKLQSYFGAGGDSCLRCKRCHGDEVCSRCTAVNAACAPSPPARCVVACMCAESAVLCSSEAHLCFGCASKLHRFVPCFCGGLQAHPLLQGRYPPVSNLPPETSSVPNSPLLLLTLGLPTGLQARVCLQGEPLLHQRRADQDLLYGRRRGHDAQEGGE